MRAKPRHDQKSALAEYTFDLDNVKSGSEPSEDTVHLIWMLLTLLRRREVSYAAFAKECGRSARTFKRHLAKLRTVGERLGFRLSHQRAGVARLLALDGMPDPRRKASADAADALRAVVDALGELVRDDLEPYVDTSAALGDPFLRLAAPRLIDDSVVAERYRFLRAAWQSGARVRFRYPVARSKTGATEERTVEPHLVTYYDGRYYLVAFDRRPATNAWRQFAIDRIAGPIARARSFRYRIVPRAYRGEDAIGLFKDGSRSESEIAVEFSPAIADAVTSRRWHRTQAVEKRAGDWTRLRFHVSDLGEAVRWALGFGLEARVVAPAAAVALAREISRTVADRYAEPAVEDDRAAERA